MRHIIDAIAAQGRGDDTELLHVTKGEMAGLDALARRHFGRELPRNPRTGLKEASLFQDWLGSDVGQVMDVAAPVAVAFIPGVGPVAATAMGAGIGAANQGLGKNGTTESALMGGVMGGIGAYGGSGLAEGLGAGASAAPTTTGGATATTTPIGQAGANLGGTAFTAPAGESTMNIADAGNLLKPTTGGATGLQAPPTAMQNVAPTIQGGATTTTAPATTAGQANLSIPEGGVKSLGGETSGTNWDYLKSKDALGNATAIGTSAIGTMGIPGAPTNTTSTGPGVNKTLPKSEVYYTPYGERRTRIVAAEGGLMSMNGAYGDYDGAEDDQGIRRYGNGGGIGFIHSIQPGGEWGDMTADMYGAVQEHKPDWLQKAEPGGFIGATVPGKLDWEAKQQAEAAAKTDAENAKNAAAAKAAKDAAFQQQWQDRYKQNFAAGGVMSLNAAKGRYLQGPGDGMSDSIPANIDGKQEARLASGEFVVPADVVSGLGNGDSTAGAKQLHAMMDRTRQARTGTKQQGKQINPRKVMPV